MKIVILVLLINIVKGDISELFNKDNPSKPFLRSGHNGRNTWGSSHFWCYSCAACCSWGNNGICSTSDTPVDREYCYAGYYSDNNKKECKCFNGVRKIGSGTNSGDHSSYCSGEHPPTYGCTICPFGQIGTSSTWHTDTDACADCPTGHGSDSSRSNCVDCNSNDRTKYMGTACNSCPAGKLSAASGDTSCDVDCNVGNRFKYISGNNCEDCPTGKWAPNPGDTCNECNADNRYKYLNLVTNTCDDCPDDDWAPNPGDTSCEEEPSCDVGEYLDNVAGMCTACPDGQYQDVESVDTSCKTKASCPAGKYRSTFNRVIEDVDGNECEDCLAGSYSVSSPSNPCIPCEAGRWNDQPGMVSCNNCPAGESTT